MHMLYKRLFSNYSQLCIFHVKNVQTFQTKRNEKHRNHKTISTVQEFILRYTDSFPGYAKHIKYVQIKQI